MFGQYTGKYLVKVQQEKRKREVFDASHLLFIAYYLKSWVPRALEGQISLISFHEHTVFLP